MNRTHRKWLVVLGVVAGVVIVLSVALRIVLTEERLKAMLVPRIEKAVDARIAVGRVGIRFPFGFGVRIGDLSFEKQMPRGERVSFAAADLRVDVPLSSLLRRRPEIRSVNLSGASLQIDAGGEKPQFALEDLAARLSMKPIDTLYVLDPRIAAGRLVLTARPSGAVFELPDLRFEARVEISGDFQRFAVRGGKLSLADLAAADLEATATDLRGRQEFTVRARVDELEARRLFEVALETDFSAFVPGLTEEALGEMVPVTVQGGTIALALEATGTGSEPGEIAVAGTVRLEGIALRSAAIDLPVRLIGAVEFSETRIACDGIDVEAGRSTARVLFSAPLEGTPKKPGTLEFEIGALVDIGETAAALTPPQPGAAGKLETQLRGAGSPAHLGKLFPAGADRPGPETIREAWKNLRLEGFFSLSNAELPADDQPLRVSRINARGTIAGGDVKGIGADFSVGGSPWKASGEMKGILPALAEAMLIVQDDDPPATAGAFLDRLTSTPDVSLSVSGRSLNVIPLQDRAAAEREARKAQPPGVPPAPAAAPHPLVDNPLAILMLKKTSLSVRIDSLTARGAVLTAIDAAGRLSDGLLRASPVTLAYAGGKGSGSAQADLRDLERIATEVDIAFTGIQAGQALAELHGAGGLVSGEFSFSLGGRFESGPGIDPLQTLAAAAAASSSRGVLDLSRFMAPLAATGIALPIPDRFDFHELSGKFSIDAGRVATDSWLIRSNAGDWKIAGSFGFDGSLDYRAGLVLTPAQQSRMKDLQAYRALVDLFRDEAGNIVLDFDIGGTAREPQVALDQTRARRKAGEKIVDEAQKKLLDLLRRR